MKYITKIALLICLIQNFSTTHGAEWWSSYLPEQVCLFVSIDFEQTDMAAAQKVLFDPQYHKEPEIDEYPTIPSSSNLEEMLEELAWTYKLPKQYGVKKVILILSKFGDPRQNGYLLLHQDGNSSFENLKSYFDVFKGKSSDGPYPELRVMAEYPGDRILALAVEGKFPQKLDRLPSNSEAFAQAWSRVGNFPIHAILAPSESDLALAKIMSKTIPDKHASSAAGILLDSDIQWLATGIRLNEKPLLSLVIRASNKVKAKRMRERLETEIRSTLLDYKLPRLLDRSDYIPKQDEETVTLSFSESSCPLMFAEVFSPLAARLEAIDRWSLTHANLTILGMALDNYAAHNKLFPGDVVSEARKPLLSWRVFLLPTLGEEALFKKFHFDEPWDSPHNKTLIPEMPDLFVGPYPTTQDGFTHYLAPIGKDMLLDPEKAIGPNDITDGSMTAILVVSDRESAVPWTKPVDYNVDPKDPVKRLRHPPHGNMTAYFHKGSVLSLITKNDPVSLISIFIINDGV
ncbi:DUF1559 family PulG-like putative transporter [Calycomorphotria hydatis]|uniref:DUF1559 domain-containing protein n=1 Tax=Calycomorphotria hydatis TaxID=2528027 RepID=A0A517TFC7_9PLAN|nr:DUF1559 domain-containing protein [Calycomorphotria hydatis]QDT67081.1 hypothetical protein V22_43540 [Calycomorphotria hydatis]